MRIAVVTETYPPEVNGVSLTVQSLVGGMAEIGHDLLLVRPRQPGVSTLPLAQPLHELLVRGATLPKYPGLRFGFPAGRSLARLFGARRPEAVYVATEGPLGWSAVRTARRLGIPVATGFHTRFDAYAGAYGLGSLTPLVRQWLRLLHNIFRSDRRADARAARVAGGSGLCASAGALRRTGSPSSMSAASRRRRTSSSPPPHSRVSASACPQRASSGSARVRRPHAGVARCPIPSSPVCDSATISRSISLRRTCSSFRASRRLSAMSRWRPWPQVCRLSRSTTAPRAPTFAMASTAVWSRAAMRPHSSTRQSLSQPIPRRAALALSPERVVRDFVTVLAELPAF